MKAVFVCAAGMNRSHAMVLKAKTLWNWDAFAVGLWGNPSIFPVIAPWADRIVLVERWWPEHFLASEHLKKVVWLETGLDIWGSPSHPDLLDLAGTLLLHWQKVEFKPGVLVVRSGQVEEIQDARPKSA